MRLQFPDRQALKFAGVAAAVALREVARKEGVSVNTLISTAVAEKVSALMTEDYLKARAVRGNWDAFDAALALVPDTEPTSEDRLP